MTFWIADYVSELQQLHPLFATWANSELELSPVLLSIAKAVESNVAAHQKLLACPYNEEKEYTVYIDAVKDALSRRDCMQIDYELTVDELTKKRQEKEQVHFDFIRIYFNQLMNMEMRFCFIWFCF